MYEFLITAAVPLVCRLDLALAGAGTLLCNAPGGYELYARAPAGETRLLDSADGPTAKPFAHTLRDGERLILVPRGPALPR